MLLNNDAVPRVAGLQQSAWTSAERQPSRNVRPCHKLHWKWAKVAVEYHDLDGLEQFAYRYTWAHNGQEFRNVKALALFCTMIHKSVIQQMRNAG